MINLSNKVCVTNKIEVLNIHVFNMIAGKNESKTLTNDISRECKCKFVGRKGNSNQKLNNGKCRYEFKNHNICTQIIFGILLHVVVKMVNI